MSLCRPGPPTGAAHRWLPAVPIAMLVAFIQVGGTVGSAHDHQQVLRGPAFALLLAGPAAIALLSRWRMVPLTVSVLAVFAYGLLSYPVGPIFLAPLAALGIELFRGRRERGAAMRRMQQLDRERAQVEERVAIARELHDVIGHSLSLINVQAAVALHVLDQHPEHIPPTLQTIKSVSHEALEEVRVVLDRLRDPTASAQRAPAATLTDLPRLVEQSAGAQTTWRLVVQGERGRVPAAVDAAAYRVAQESMTNVRRHAGASHASVEVGYGTEYSDRARMSTLALRVTDDGRAAMAGEPVVEGSGMTGMRERVEALGGTFEATRPAAGGFQVQAQIRWQQSESTPQ